MIPYRLYHVTAYTLQGCAIVHSYLTTYDCRQHAESLATVIADCAGTFVTVESEGLAMDQQPLPSDWTLGEWNTGLAVDDPWQPAMVRQGPAGQADVLPVRSTGEVAGMGYVLPIDRIRIPA